jgi:putative phosphoribosyl transferase
MRPQPVVRRVAVPTRGVKLDGDLHLPLDALGLVIFAHGSGSSRHSPRNRQVAVALQRARLGTLLVDLLTPEEGEIDDVTRHLRFDVGLLADRLTGISGWVRDQDPDLAIGFFGASTGAAAALIAAAHRPHGVGAVVSRGGRPDLAGDALPAVVAPTLLIVGGNDREVLRLNREAQARMRSVTDLAIVPGATHLFEEPGALEEVSRLASGWFVRHLGGIGIAADAPRPPPA